MEGLDSFAPDVDFNAEPAEEPQEIALEKEQPPAEIQLELPVDEPKEAPVETPKEEAKQERKLVPLEALHESRIREREWRDKAAQIEKEAAERFKKLEERLERIANPPPAVPDFETDPAGHLKHAAEQTRAELESLKAGSEQQRQQFAAQEMERQIAASTQAAESVFMKDHPDYLQAVGYLQGIADKNMQMMGVDDPNARAAQIRADAIAMSRRALEMGKSPAEVAFQLATNYGYKSQGNGAAAPQNTEAAKRLAAIQAGQKTDVLPSGGTKNQPLTLAALEQMDDDEFNKMVDDDASWKKLTRQMV